MFRRFRAGSSEGTGLESELIDAERANLPVPNPDIIHSQLPHRSYSTPGGSLTLRPTAELRPSLSSQRHLAASDTTLAGSSSTRSSRRTTFFRDKSPTPEDPLGLILIHGSGSSEADIIFVHGLGGSSRKTWSWNRDPNYFWPSWIHHEEGLSQFRIFSFGYNANFREPDTPLSIMDFSKSLLVRMRAYGHGALESDAIGLKPIVFVAHSMGGLVVKKALMLGKTHDQYAAMLSKVHGIMFFSTPHKGSSHASTLNSLLSMLIGSSAKVYVSELDPNSTSIEDISEQFRGICGSWQLVSLYETQPTKLSPGIKRMIVDKDSGVLSYPKEISVPIDADHHTICKFQSRLDPNYCLAVDLLRQLTEGLRSPPTKALVRRTTSNNPPPSVFDQAKALENILDIKGNARSDLERHLTRALPGSCQWLHRNSRFREWLDGADDSHDVLWLSGLPGTGKSTVAAKTIHHIQQALHQSSCQCHFFMESQPTKQNVAYCLRTIAFQLAKTHQPFAERLLQLHKETGFTAAEQKFGLIWDTIFENIVFKMDFGRTLHWIFDGLDEADAPKLLVRSLLHIKSKTRIKLLLFSRPKKDLTNILMARFGAVPMINVSVDQTQEDIEQYVGSVASEIFPDAGEPIHEYVIQQITKRAEGSFLWTRLALETLRDNWHTQADIDMALNDVPNGMHSLYQRMIQNVNSQSSRLQEIALRILTWTSCAFRPLTIPELSAALQPEFDGFVNLSETVEQICGQFVRVDDGRVSLIHSTARQFLLNAADNVPAPVGAQAGHNRLAIACLQYLSQDHWRQRFALLPQERTFTDRLKPLYDKFPLLRYSLNHWAFHVSHASTDNSTLLSFLRLFCNKYILQWAQAVALADKLELLPTAARYLKVWIRRKRRQSNIGDLSPTTRGMTIDESLFVEEWTTDLIRIVGKFGLSLVQSPSSIHKNIPPLCPVGSITWRTYSETTNPLVSVKGLSVEGWDDNLARLALGEDEMASAIRCAGNYFLALITHNGTVVVWHKETCEEIYRLHHGEWVTILATDKPGRLAATAGRYTFRVWELTSGKLLYKLPKISPARTMSVEFAQSGSKLLISYDDCSMSLYDLESGREEALFAEPNGQAMQRSCPRFMAPSPDQTKLAIAFRGRPVTLWDVVQSQIFPSPKPRMCIRKDDKDLEVDGDEVFNSPEVVRWSPDGSTVYILYQDATILVWDLIEDGQFERGDTGAREMVLNSDGTLLLTSGNGGSLRVWSLPTFHLIYELNSDEFVRDLSFSPDSQRIYDVRGSGCNVWAPDILIRPDALDHKETASSVDASFVSDVMSEPVLAQDQQAQRGHVTALICDNHDEFFCVGRDDGSVNIHDIADGKVVRKAYKHSASVDIVVLEWSASRRFIASADDSGKVIVKKLKIKDDGKWAVFPMFDLRVGEAVTQMLFNQNETLLLISMESSDRLWDLKTKSEVCRRRWDSKAGHKWMNHPDDPARIIWISNEQIRVHTWAGLATETEEEANITVTEDSTEDKERVEPAEGQEDPDDDDDGHLSLTRVISSPRPVTPLAPGFSPEIPKSTIRRVIKPSNRRHILYQSQISQSRRTRSSGTKTLYLLNMESMTNARRRPLITLSEDIRHLLGCVRDKIAFIDHENWVCTASLSLSRRETGPASVNRHFFLRRDWVNSLTLQVVSKDGTLLSARNGEVAVVGYAKGF
ncbi:putative WD40 domain-containing protein [Cercophora samala]|uniref:GPI inositol-deacylase n=1 Tax=Cercophora samala TaxID=330535 RepID=A0AA39Z9H1_9PEZI|nr:putative WD40 domain-containing protein [Cercophora samala]